VPGRDPIARGARELYPQRAAAGGRGDGRGLEGLVADQHTGIRPQEANG
jgi:hypothetical protein